MNIIKDFKDYEVLDIGYNQKYERWGTYYLVRPETSAIFDKKLITDKVDAIYTRSVTGGGNWDIKSPSLPDKWQITYKDLIFNLKLMGFKHTGLFPEQAANWDFIREKISNSPTKVKVLNLFAYTGAATVAALKEGADVVHVDASKGMIEWAKENVITNKLENENVHFICEDVLKFVKREIRRGHKYDIIIMDPPTFGRGSKNEVWTIDKNLSPLIDECVQLLSNDSIAMIINTYSNGITSTVIENILKLKVVSKFQGKLESNEMGFQVKDSNLIMPCGIYTRWSK